MRRVVCVLVLIFGLAGNACVSRTVSVVVGDDNGERPVSLCTGCDMTVTLPGNPTTGYLWEVAALDHTVLQQVGEPEFRPESSLIGSPGLVTFRFRGFSAGSTTIRFIYHRPFEKGQPPLRTRDVAVMVTR